MAARSSVASKYVISPTPAGDDRAYLDFVLGLRTYWGRQLYPALEHSYEERLAATGQRRPRFAEEAGPIVQPLPQYRLFGWMERNVQKMMWRHLDRVVRPNDEELVATLNRPIENPLGRLELDPDLELPSYYTETDFHIQPGGVWSADENVFIYEVGAKIVMFGENDDYLFHRLFVETAIPEREYGAILDMACGFGKSTRPLVDRFPKANVVGIDLSAPNLKLAHHQAERLGRRITFSQRNAESTGYADESFDLVTGTMILHELPMPRVRRVLEEARRLLRPGGVVAFLEFHRTGDAFRDFAMLEHGARNNEPYLPHLFRTDMVHLCREVGFSSPEMLPFDERGAGLLEDGHWPHRPEWHFPWVVIRMER